MSLVLQWQLVKTGRCPQHVELANHLGQKKEKCHGHVVTSALTQEQKNVPTWRTCRECCALLPLRQRCWSILLCSAPVNRNVFQIIIQRKLQFFGHICRMKNARMLKAIVFGVMEGKARKGRPYREWTDDIKEDLHTLRWKATDRAEWRRVVRHSIDTNGWPRPS